MFEIANAPISSQTGFGPEDCIAVDWLGSEQKCTNSMSGCELVSIALDPEGIFQLDQGELPDDDDEAPPCAGHEWQGDDPPDCYVSAKQVAH